MLRAVFEARIIVVDDEIDRPCTESARLGVRKGFVCEQTSVFLSLLCMLLFFHFLSLSFHFYEQYLTLLCRKGKRGGDIFAKLAESYAQRFSAVLTTFQHNRVPNIHLHT